MIFSPPCPSAVPIHGFRLAYCHWGLLWSSYRFISYHAPTLSIHHLVTSDSGTEEHNGKSYVVLRNIRGVLAVYSVQDDDSIRQIKRWPKALQTE